MVVLQAETATWGKGILKRDADTGFKDRGVTDVQVRQGKMKQSEKVENRRRMCEKKSGLITERRKTRAQCTHIFIEKVMTKEIKEAGEIFS